MKNIIKNERGVTLVSLAVAIIILGIITTLLLYNVKDTKDIERVSNMYIDIEGISDRISNYYSRYGALPVTIDVTSDPIVSGWISELQSENNEGPLGANDTGKFYVIDLNALENLSLNYGSGFTKINGSTLPEDKDVYVINENSHNIFYLHGIRVNNNGVIKMYYTNQEKDTEVVSTKYVDQIKIPDGFIFKSGNTKNDLKIEKVVTGGTNIEYTWANTADNVYTMTKIENDNNVEYHLKSGDTFDSKILFDTTNGQNAEDLIQSAKEFGGFYYAQGSNADTINVYYFSVAEDDNWGIPYKATATYTDKNGDKAYIPAGFKISKLSSLNTINKGLVIKNDTTQDEYVWIDVPDNVLANARTLEEIEKALKDYTKDYREEGYDDTYPEGLVMTNDPNKNNMVVYNDLKNKMLQSIKQNGGFYIGRYEAGNGTNNVIVSQKNKPPCWFKTISQAQELADDGTNNYYNTSLMFGIQWDLICKFIEESGAKSYAEITENSTLWGNYSNSNIEFTNEVGEMFIYGGSRNWENINGYDKTSGTKIAYTTGVTTRNMVLNIFDLAGNVWEYTLEGNNNNCVLRGGGYQNDGNNNAAMAKHRSYRIGAQYTDFGFRVTLFQTPATSSTEAPSAQINN
ncbi:MAG: hypothetical protein IJJ82_02340 [Clostridia bacterium]|nr:hypothetical protein [Clostridia bacterium]